MDDVQSFFEAVHHLRDWLGKDPSSSLTREAADTFVNSSLVLSLCADIANGSKHFTLTTTRTGDLSTTIARNDVDVLVGTGTSRHRFYVASNGMEHDVLALAEDAVTEWDSFLRSLGLLV